MIIEPENCYTGTVFTTESFSIFTAVSSDEFKYLKMFREEISITSNVTGIIVNFKQIDILETSNTYKIFSPGNTRAISKLKDVYGLPNVVYGLLSQSYLIDMNELLLYKSNTKYLYVLKDSET